jgi:hypothetical protein
MKQLGPIHGLPDALKHLEEMDFDFDFDFDMEGEGLLELRLHGDPHHNLQFFGPHGKRFHWYTGEDEDEDVQVHMHVEMSDSDGSMLSIKTEEDGVIHVTRVDAEGNESSEVYESEEALEEDDPEAFEVFSGHVKGPRRQVFIHRPFGDEAIKLREEFQINIEEKLREALERAEEAQERAFEALERAREQMGEAEIELEEEIEVDDSILGARVDDNGKTTVYIRDDEGMVRKYQFPSLDAFKAAEPELYEHVKHLLD